MIVIPDEVELCSYYCFHLETNYNIRDKFGCQIDVVFQIKIIFHNFKHLNIGSPDGGTIL